jgi:hypothetical protein
MRRPLQFFSGYLRDNINQVIYSPIEGSDQETADDFTKLSYYIWDKGQGFPTFLSAADEMFKAGISLCGIQMDYSKDFKNGDIGFYKRTYNTVVLDPTFERIDLQDCSFAITRDLISKDYAKDLLPDIDPELIDDLPMSYRDDKFLQYHPQFTTFSRNRNLIAYDQFYKRTTRKRKMLVDTNSMYYRDVTDLEKEEMDRLKIGMRRLQELRSDSNYSDEFSAVELMTVDRPFVELHVLLNGVPVYSGEDRTGITESYPFVPLLCYFEPSIWMPSQRIQGIPSTCWSLQRQFNKRHMKIPDIMDTQISSGFKYLIGSVPDVSDLQQSGQSKLIGVDPENAPQGLDSVQELRGGQVDASIMQYQQILDQLSLTLANVNESVLGIDKEGNTQISGRLAEVRIAQGLRGNRSVFDNIETAQQVLGGLILKCIQSKYSPEKVARILGKPPTQQFYEKEFEQYDAVIKQGVRSKSQKDAYYYELVNLKREGIVDVPQSEIVKALSMAGLSDLEKAIQAQEEQASQQKAKIEEQERMSLELANAQKEQMLALAQERRARVVADLALSKERASEAEQNRAAAALDRAKTITEIAAMREDRLMKVIEFVNALEMQESTDREVVNASINQEANNINSETEGSFENQQKLMRAQMMQQQENTMQAYNQGG